MNVNFCRNALPCHPEVSSERCLRPRKRRASGARLMQQPEVELVWIRHHRRIQVVGLVTAYSGHQIVSNSGGALRSAAAVGSRRNVVEVGGVGTGVVVQGVKVLSRLTQGRTAVSY